MKVKQFVSGLLQSNGYVIYQKEGGSCWLIDPGYHAKQFAEFIKEKQLKTMGILLTHLHHDHCGASAAASDTLDCPIYMHEKDAAVYGGRVDVFLKDGQELTLDGESLKIIHTPGHTAGSICIMCPKSRICFTGDTLFDTDLGRTDLAGGSEKEMEHTVRNILDTWEQDIRIYPGHDLGCTMKKVRIYNSEFLALRDGYDR